MATKLDDRRMNDGKKALTESETLPNSFEKLLEMRESVYGGIAALQSLDDLGTELNTSMASSESILQGRLKEIDKKLKQLMPTMEGRFKKWAKNKKKVLIDAIDNLVAEGYMDLKKYELLEIIMGCHRDGVDDVCRTNTIGEPFGYAKWPKPKLVEWLNALDDFDKNRIMDDQYSEIDAD